MPDPAATPGAAPFPGTRDECDALLEAIHHSCVCQQGGAGATCGPHSLLRDRAVLKRLVFSRRWHQQRRSRSAIK